MQNRQINTNEMVYGIWYNIEKDDYDRLHVDYIVKYTDDGHAYVQLTNGNGIYVDIDNLFFSKEDMELEILKRKGKI